MRPSASSSDSVDNYKDAYKKIITNVLSTFDGEDSCMAPHRTREENMHHKYRESIVAAWTNSQHQLRECLRKEPYDCQWDFLKGGKTTRDVWFRTPKVRLFDFKSIFGDEFCPMRS